MQVTTRWAIAFSVSLGLLCASSIGSAQIADDRDEFVRALTTGRSTVYEGKRYVWSDGAVRVEVDGELRAERGVDAVVRSVVPMASTAIQFDDSEGRIASVSAPVVDALAAALSTLGDVAVALYAFADDETDDELRQRTEEKRLKILREELIRRGVDPDRLLADSDPPSDGSGNVSVVVHPD